MELAERGRNNGDLAGIRGLSYRGPEGVVHNPARDPIKDLDALPFPIMHKLNDNLYSYPNSLMKKIAPILASRGCPGTMHLLLHPKRRSEPGSDTEARPTSPRS